MYTTSNPSRRLLTPWRPSAALLELPRLPRILVLLIGVRHDVLRGYGVGASGLVANAAEVDGLLAGGVHANPAMRCARL